MIALPMFRGCLSASRFDSDALAYFARITAAGSSISAANKAAVNALVVGCKADGIWTAIKASCLLAGPDSIAGALAPLVGVAPTNNGFGSGDHSRTLGIVGNGTKWVNANRLGGTDAQNDKSIGVWGTYGTVGVPMGCGTTGFGSNSLLGSSVRLNTSTATSHTAYTSGFYGASRNSSSSYIIRAGGSNSTAVVASSTPINKISCVFDRSNSRGTANNGNYCDMRMGFYHIGSALDLALLDARLTTYMAALT